MKRMIFNLSIAFIAFCIGVAAELAFQKYLEVPFPSICETPQPSLLARLVPVPEESGNTTFSWQSDSYSKCSDEWAMDRRNAIQYERTKYLVIY